MLVYNSLNKFYTGDDINQTTPLTAEYLNSLINQIEKNFENLDIRLENVESIIIDKKIFVDEANINLGKIDNLYSKNVKIDNAFIDKLALNEGAFSKITSEEGNFTNVTIKNSDIVNSKIENLLSNKAKINDLKLQQLDISENYTFASEGIYFVNSQPGIIFDIEKGSNGIRFDSETNGSKNARIEFDIKNGNFTIEFLSENVNEFFKINSNRHIILDAEQIDLKSNIIPTENVELGNENNIFGKIYSKQFYGSYFSYNADLAEFYEADAEYEPGTLLMVGIETEGTIYDPDNPRPILGIVSSEPAIILNNKKTSKLMTPIALKGRVFCKLEKKGKRGDYIIPSKKLKGYCIPTEKITDNVTDNVIGILIDPVNNIIKV